MSLALVVPQALRAPAVAASAFVVDTTSDSIAIPLNNVCDICSLREAIEEANNNGNPGEVDTIAFAIPGAGPHTITPTTALPAITEPVLIDGYSQAGASPNAFLSGTNAVLRIVIDGALLPSAGLTLQGSNTTIKGLVITGFNGPGIAVDSGSGNRIEGNFIGTTAAGTAADANTRGIQTAPAVNGLTIGGPTVAARNLISGNSSSGIGLGSGPSNGGRNIDIVSNLIGTEPDGLTALGNGGFGIGGLLPANANVNIARFGALVGNVIHNNASDGVGLLTSGSGLLIQQNSFLNNGGLAIDLGPGGVTPNDRRDRDGGVNRLQNFPVLSSAVAQTVGPSEDVRVNGSLRSTPHQKFRIDLYSSHSAFADPSGHGEGQRWLGTLTIKTNDKGKRSFSTVVSDQTNAPRVVTATATRVSTRDTSEFSAAVPLTIV